MRRALGIIPILLFASLCFAAQPDRISGTIDSYPSVLVTGSVHAKAQPQSDQGPVAPSFTLPYITMMMQPSARQQADLQQLLKQQQDPTSPNFRKWLTPEQYADRFGLSQNDIEKLSVWLRGQGFSIVQAARGRNWIAFSGTAALVESAFHTQIHYFNVDGQQHFANATEVSIPQALAGIVAGIRGLNDFSLTPMGIKAPGPADFFPLVLAPSYDLGGQHFLAPGDIATIYDIAPLYSASINGTGMKMVVVGQVDVSGSLSDIDNFRSTFGLTKNDPQQTIVPGSPNPGTNSGDMLESKLDLEWAGAVAQDATILFITADVSANGVFGAAIYAIDNNLAPVISMSYGACEAANAPLAPLESELQKANSEGITFLASSGDTGAAGCDDSSASVATMGLAVNYPASSPEATGVGGNEFNEGSGTYWTGSNPNGGTAISYIPEMGWNDSPVTGTGPLPSPTLAASGGGASSCGTAASNSCTGGFGFPKPTWQTGTGVPNDGVRDVPDVAMAASANHDGYIICDAGSCTSGIGTNPTIVGGTSAATPVFAGIVTLLNQFLKANGLGNINPKLYQIAQNSSNNVFHDVTTGDNIVPCASGTPSCPNTSPLQFGYNAGTGYDQVTGLGSVDAHLLALNFLSATTTTLTASANPSPSSSSVTFTATVTTTGSNAPTGAVTFNDGANSIGTGSLTTTSGKTTASLSSSSLADGGHSLTAVYPGDSKNAPSTSAALIETITANGGLLTTTTLVPGQGALAYGTAATFTATVTTTSGNAPANTVTFQDGTTPLGFVAVTATGAASGSATFSTATLTAGTHSITGLYSGDTNNNAPSTSNPPISQTITQAPTTTTLASVSSPVNIGASVTLSATVSFAAGNPPNGETVTFKDNNTGKTLGTGKLAGGSAAFGSTSIAGGSYAVVATYAGDANLSASGSSPAQTLNVLDFSVAANPTTVGVSAPGQTGSTTLTITPLGGFSNALTFNCGGLPSEATCTFASAGTNSEKVTIATTAASGWKRPFGRGSGIFYAMLLPGVMGLVLPARRRSLRSMLSLFVVLAVLVLWMPACGGGGGSNSNPGTPTGSSTVTITASSNGNGPILSHAVTVTLSIQ
jgi:subtilase family serine protease